MSYEEIDLFSSKDQKNESIDQSYQYQPLSDRLRPRRLDEIIGQDHLIGKNGLLKRMISSNSLSSMILWGPPGTGKTTIARVLANETHLNYDQLSAIFAGVHDLKKIFERAGKIKKQTGQPTLLFIDEIHRFNRSQQDGFLPFVENGTIILVGATTENPSFSLNNALLSRCRIMVLNRLTPSDFEHILARAEHYLNNSFHFEEGVKETLFRFADGDARAFLNMIEQMAHQFKTTLITFDQLENFLQYRVSLYDKNQDEHYNLISALHKSMRGSDADAALYWFARMIQGGEDVNYIARRLTRFAAEDIGLASPNALTLAISAWQAYERLGSPEGELAIAELIIYLATCPKSNSVYKAYHQAIDFVKKTGSLMPPKHILNAPTSMMKNLGYGKGYIYDHDTEDTFSGQNYFPEEIEKQEFYLPSQQGMEENIAQRIQYWKELMNKKIR